MSKPQDRIVYKNKYGKWVNKRVDAIRPSGVHDTQLDAIDEAREMLHNQGGGELSIKGEDGKIRRKVTIPDGNDPFPPRDKT